MFFKPQRCLAAAWKTLGIDWHMFFLMLKGSIPVAVSLSLYQSTAAAETYTSLGFLVAIIAVVTVNLLPRAKLLQMTLSICASTAIAIPLAMLATWSGLQARHHTDPQGLHAYNSSQSAITGVWLFFHIWLSNSIQARYPHLLIPTILYNIFMIVQFTSCSRFTTWSQCWDLIYLTTRCYFTGVAISFVSGILIYPINCRYEVFELQEKYIHCAQAVLQQALYYVTTIRDGSSNPSCSTQPEGQGSTTTASSAAEEGVRLQRQMSDLKAIYVKMHAELIMAKREVAWGKLSATDLTTASDMCRRILMPIGLSHIPDLLQQLVNDDCNLSLIFDQARTDTNSATTISAQDRSRVGDKVLCNSIEALIQPACAIIAATHDGFEHAGLQLEIIREPEPSKLSNKADTESRGNKIQPGDANFSFSLEDALAKFWTDRLASLKHWTEYNDFSSEKGETETRSTTEENVYTLPVERESLHSQRLHLMLYIHQMLYSTGVAVLELCKFSDDLRSQGIMSRNRMILPSLRVSGQWLASIFDTSEAAIADEDRPSGKKEKGLVFGQSKRRTYNIDHLPPSNSYQTLGTKLRGVQKFLRGPEFSFGFRSACATMSCAILAYLRQTQDDFTHYRLIWSVIIAAIGANMSAGQSGVSYVLRILGSLAALIICYLVWYIPNGNTAGVIVLMWFASFVQMYFLLRWPRHLIGWLVILITEVLSIGYLTQVNKIGVEAATAKGVIYYKPYEVCAVRVACVLLGTLVSIFWTYLPYPITARSLMRDQLARSMQLIANYNIIVHHTIKARLRGKEGDLHHKQSQGYAMSRARKAMFNKTMALNASIKHGLYLQKYEPTLGGKFPAAIYSDILSQTSTLLDYISLLSYSTQAWSSFGTHARHYQHSDSARQWMRDLADLIAPANTSAEKITSVLYQLSSAVTTGRQLPGALEDIKPYELWRTLEQSDPQILQSKHIRELGYSTYAVVEVLSNVIAHKINDLSRNIEDLVGVTCFDTMVDEAFDEVE
ncbi:hypothetical protein KCU78_g1930, partial [Aureobasidium melanogenum]